ncbi:MAG: nucleotide sugar dehydrogenase [Oscillospiraceae bacterium]|nr:nucleotide sugar dehydrogenase [Oscillospiraceae bacterium]
MIAVIGLGYVGLPMSLMMAANGLAVTGVDINEEVISSLKNGKTTFDEEGMDALYARAVENGIRFDTSCPKADTYIVSVPTPYMKLSKKIDPTYVTSAVSGVLDVCEKGCLIVVESTISPGTIDTHVRPLIEKRGLKIGGDVHLAHAPERIFPGNTLYELKNVSRTIGADSREIAERVRAIYSSFCTAEISLTDIRTAEMSKVVENTYRDINIAYANELARICRVTGLDVYETIRIANTHPRVNILNPGPGVGGHCIPIDPWFLVGDYPGLANLIFTARKCNDSMPEYVLERACDIMREHGIKDVSRVGLYGISYKEDVDDTRESPTLQILKCMEKHLSFGVKAYDPFVKKPVMDGQYMDFNEFLSSVDLVIIMVGHTHIIENMDALKSKVVLDTKNVCPFETAHRL